MITAKFSGYTWLTPTITIRDDSYSIVESWNMINIWWWFYKYEFTWISGSLYIVEIDWWATITSDIQRYLSFSQVEQASSDNAQLVEDIGTGTINILQEFASVPRVAAIAGKSNRPLMKEFTGKDLQGIQRVTVDMGNPMTRTTAGKVNLADAFLEKGIIDNADQYIQVVTTGRLEPIIEGKQAQLLLIKAENEELSEGRPQRVLATDNHAKHILEHTTVLSNPEIRQDPDNPVVAETLAHIQEHIAFMNDPLIQQMMAILHQEAVPPAPTPQVGQQLNPDQAVMQEASNVNLPNAPQPPQGTDPRSAEVIAQQAPIAI